MSKVFQSTRSHFARLAFAASYGTPLPWLIAAVIQAISSIQILYLILATSFPTSEDNNLQIFDVIRDASSWVGFLHFAEVFDSNKSRFILWVIFAIYLILYMGFLSTVAFLCQKKQQVHPKLSTVLTQWSIVHSKVFFCAIYTFYQQFLVSQRSCENLENPPFYCNSTGINAFTIFLLIINSLLALVKEFYFYQVYKNKNFFALKNNLHGKIHLGHKLIMIPLLVTTTSNLILNSLINLFLTVYNHIFIFLNLPYFNLIPLKLLIIYSTINTTLSFTLLWRTLAENHIQKFELFTVLIVPTMIRIMLSLLNYIFQRIITLKTRSPAFVIHLPILLKDLVFKPKAVDFSAHFKFNTLVSYGILKAGDFDVNDLRDYSKVKSLKHKLNAIVLEQLLRCYSRRPKNIMLLLFLIQFYIEKIKNITRASVYFQKVGDLPLFIAEINSTMHMRNQLETMLGRAYYDYDQSLEFISYFKYREISTMLKKDIETEAERHIELWRMFLGDKMSVTKVFRITLAIDKLALKIKNIWEKNQDDFIKNFPVPLLMYGTYLNILRGVPHLGQALIDKFTNGKNSKLLKSIEEWFSQEKATIVASNQKGSIGKIMDASHSVKNLFNIEKKDLLGRKVNALMPNMIQEKHDSLVQKYNEKPVYASGLDQKVYCKTADGYFFYAHLGLRVYPYIDKGMGLISMITKEEECVPMFFVDLDGNVVDCSRDLIETFQMDFSVAKRIKLHELAPDFERINTAFNKIYSADAAYNHKQKEEEEYSPDTLSSNLNLRKNFNGYSPLSVTNQDTPLTSRGNDETQNSTSRKFLKKKTTTKIQDILGYTALESEESPEKKRGPRNSGGFINLDFDFHSPVAQTWYEKPRFSQRIASNFLGHISNNPEYYKAEGVIKVQDIDEMDKICKQYQSGGVMVFKGHNTSEYYDTFLQYSVKIEPFIFQDQFFKVVKLKKIKKKDIAKDREDLAAPTPHWAGGSSSKRGSSGEANTESPWLRGLRRKITTSDFVVRTNRSSYNSNSLSAFEKKIADENQEVKAMSMEVNVEEEGLKKKKGAYGGELAKGDKDFSEGRNLHIEKTLYRIFDKDNASKFIQSNLGCFYFFLFVTFVLTIVNYAYIKFSFHRIELSAQLVNIGSERIASLVHIWNSCTLMYAGALLGLNYGMFSSVVTTEGSTLYGLNLELMNLLKELDSTEITSAFFKNDVTLWEPFDPTNEISTIDIDEFTGTNVVLQKLNIFNTVSVIIADPMNTDALFALNNTINGVFLSLEYDLKITQGVKDDTYHENILMTQLLIGFQVVTTSMVFFSLVAGALHVFRSNQKLFQALCMISQKSLIERERQILQFKTYLRESVESITLIQNLDHIMQRKTVYEDHLDNMKFKQRTRASFKEAKRDTIFSLTYSSALFLLIIALFCVSDYQSLRSIDRFQTIDTGTSLVTKLNYEVFLLAGTYMYSAAFYNQTTMLIRNENSQTQLAKSLESIHLINSQLISVFPKESSNIYGNDIIQLLFTDVCSYLDQAVNLQKACAVATEDNTLGLLGLNDNYYDMILTQSSKFEADPTLTNLKQRVAYYLSRIGGTVSTSVNAYTYLKGQLVDIFLARIQEERTTLTKLFVGLCLGFFFATVMLKFFMLDKIQFIANMKNKVLRVLPYNLILANRPVVFYIRLEFTSDIEEIKSIL